MDVTGCAVLAPCESAGREWPASAHVRIGWLRSVANVYHAFGIHSFADELAHAAGRDSVEYLLQLLGPDRIIPKNEIAKDYPNYDGKLRAVSDRYGKIPPSAHAGGGKAGWGKQQSGNGVWHRSGMHRSFLTYVATVVQVHVDDAGQVQIKRVDTALDAGTVVNPGNGAPAV